MSFFLSLLCFSVLQQIFIIPSMSLAFFQRSPFHLHFHQHRLGSNACPLLTTFLILILVIKVEFRFRSHPASLANQFPLRSRTEYEWFFVPKHRFLSEFWTRVPSA